MKTSEINETLCGRRVKGILTGLEVTGTITEIIEDEYTKGVVIKLDKPVQWGNAAFESYTSTARKMDDFGNLSFTTLIPETMYTIQILSKKTGTPTIYFVNNRHEVVEYLFEDDEEFFETEKIGDCMRECIEIMKRYPQFLAKVIKK